MNGRLIDVIEEAIHLMKVGLVITFFVGMVLIIGLVFSAPMVEYTFTQDHFTVANTTDGSAVIVTYDVTFEDSGEMNDAAQKDAMDEMALVSSCANEKLDTWIQNHTLDEAMHSNLEELTIQCHEENIEVAVTGKTVK